MPDLKNIISPRISKLKKDLEAGNLAALADFWQEIIINGTPLIENIPDDPKKILVTFLWCGTDLENVVLFSYLFWQGQTFALKPLKQLLNTDVWFLTEVVDSDARASYFFSLNDPLIPFDSPERNMVDIHLKFDPFNPAHFIYPEDEKDANSKEEIVSIVELPLAPSQPWLTPRKNVQKGKIELFTLKSEVLNNERNVWVYTPVGYNPDKEIKYPLLLLFDGKDYINLMSIPSTLDNLIAEGVLPPIIVVMLDSLDVNTRNKELTCYPPFADFVANNCLSWVRKKYCVSDNPATTIVGGLSYGGLGAAYVGLKYPEKFGKILSQSGSFWWKPPDFNEHEWLTRQFVESKIISTEFYIEVGLFEQTETPGGGPTQLVSNRHLRNVLQAKGFVVNYAEFKGGHEHLNWRGSFAKGLLTLLPGKFNLI